MIILFNSKDEPMIAQLTERFQDQTDVFQNAERLAINGISLSDLTDEEQAAAVEIIEDHPQAIQSSRIFHPEPLTIKTKHSVISNDNFTIMAGPCSVESEAHVMKMAEAAKAAGATVLRGGAFKPRTSPYSFQGLGEDGLRFLKRAADAFEMDVITEVMDETHVALVEKYTDIFPIGARNMQNFSLLKAVGKTNKPVMLKRGLSATIDDLLNAAEYIASEGNHQIILAERGIRTFDNKYTRNTLDVGAVPVLHSLTPYPVIVDPSHAAGHTDLVIPEALAGTAAGADGLIIEIHDDPSHALSDGAQALSPEQLVATCDQARAINKIVEG
ncbi:3-deoxy-7-phosphoheptulonate synthase [Lactobacillus sp. Sy-1]|uniref:3-deoxy-7-phosphoheptulonate synthase n=1 Tax=Lactobacillus sp. Sy-1 TaxID=2109645 RepID=UPI001C5A6781|nr:3-deoxy-7-phosphoheptulonate synthase [Lactobacillus sp. Sy-1]MBW1606274.1 3-deoxy-7-phosphoheptulonate synthase [Lactobacillus sp. Sy-1]